MLATLPHVRKLDGTEVKPSERILAKQQLATLTSRLRSELLAEGIDPDAWTEVEVPPEYDEDELIEIDGRASVGEDGEKQRPWCPATRVLEAREQEEEERAFEAKRQADREAAGVPLGGAPRKPVRRDGFDPLPTEGRVLNKNEGRWDFTLEDVGPSRDHPRGSIVLDVAVGKFLDTSLIEADVQPAFVRLLIKVGRKSEQRTDRVQRATPHPPGLSPPSSTPARTHTHTHTLCEMGWDATQRNGRNGRRVQRSPHDPLVRCCPPSLVHSRVGKGRGKGEGKGAGRG